MGFSDTEGFSEEGCPRCLCKLKGLWEHREETAGVGSACLISAPDWVDPASPASVSP